MLEAMPNEPFAKRLRRSKQERRRVVEETLKPGASVAVIARAHGVNANQVFHWRRLYREGRLDIVPAQLVPVRIHEVISAQPRDGVIRIELGRARIHIEGAVDPDSLRVVLEQAAR
jgi:transposase